MVPDKFQLEHPISEATRTATGRHEIEEAKLSEDFALAKLKDPDLSGAEIEELANHPGVMKSRKLRLALAAHPHTPRHLSLRALRELYTFDLMRFSLLPTAPADLKSMASNLLVAKLDSVTLGERISLARRCSARVAAALLLDKDSRVWQAALENGRLQELSVATAVHRPTATPAFVETICRNSKWSVRPEVRMALLLSPHTPLASAVEYARRLAPAQLRDILHNSRLPEKVRAYLVKTSQDQGR